MTIVVQFYKIFNPLHLLYGFGTISIPAVFRMVAHCALLCSHTATATVQLKTIIIIFCFLCGSSCLYSAKVHISCINLYLNIKIVNGYSHFKIFILHSS